MVIRRSGLVSVAFLLLVLCFTPLASTAGAQQQFRRLDRVEGMSYGMWYPGTVLEAKEGQYRVKWDSNDVPEWVAAERLRPMEKPTPPPPPVPSQSPIPADLLLANPDAPLSFRVGDRVEAEWRSLWSRAEVLQLGRGQYQVRWESSSTPLWVDATSVRALPAVAAPPPPAGTGQRPQPGGTATPAPARPDAPAPRAPAQTLAYRAGDKVEARHFGVGAYPATVIAVEGGRYQVEYTDGRLKGTKVWLEPSEVIGKAYTPPPLPKALPVGEYQCFYAAATVWDVSSTYLGSFAVVDGTTYRYLTGSKKTGQYRYDAATGRISWLGGELDGKLFRGELSFGRNDGKPYIILHYADTTGRKANQNCRKVR